MSLRISRYGRNRNSGTTLLASKFDKVGPNGSGGLRLMATNEGRNDDKASGGYVYQIEMDADVLTEVLSGGVEAFESIDGQLSAVQRAAMVGACTMLLDRLRRLPDATLSDQLFSQ